MTAVNGDAAAEGMMDGVARDFGPFAISARVVAHVEVNGVGADDILLTHRRQFGVANLIGLEACDRLCVAAEVVEVVDVAAVVPVAIAVSFAADEYVPAQQADFGAHLDVLVDAAVMWITNFPSNEENLPPVHGIDGKFLALQIVVVGGGHEDAVAISPGGNVVCRGDLVQRFEGSDGVRGLDAAHVIGVSDGSRLKTYVA